MKKIAHTSKIVYFEYVKVCTFFLKICTLKNIKNFVHNFFFKCIYVEYTELCTFFEKLCLSKFKIVYNSWRSVYWMYKPYIFRNLWRNFFILQKFVLNIQNFLHWYIELCTFLVKLCTLNIQNYIHFLKILLYWIYRIVNIIWKLSILNIQNCVHSLKNYMHWIYRIVFYIWRFQYPNHERVMEETQLTYVLQVFRYLTGLLVLTQQYSNESKGNQISHYFLLVTTQK